MTRLTDRIARPGAPASGPRSVLRGCLGRCPACGGGRLFGRYLKVAPACEACGTAFHHHRADDFPPYVVMFIVAHVVGYGIYASETRVADVPLWFHMAVWPTLTLVLSLGLLQPVKGGVVALQYALGMHGFDPERGREGAGGGRGGEHGRGDGLPHESEPGAGIGQPGPEGRRDTDPDRPDRPRAKAPHGQAA